MNKQKNIVKGMLWAGTASISWGVSGTVLQLISQNLAIPAHWMLSMRTSAAGAILLIISAFLYRGKIFNVFKSWPSVISLFSYAVFGLMANLYTFYYAVQTGNASMATILQYLSPLFIVFGGWFFQHSRPLKSDLLSFVIAMAGVFLCLTKGNFGHLAIPLNSFLWQHSTLFYRKRLLKKIRRWLCWVGGPRLLGSCLIYTSHFGSTRRTLPEHWLHPFQQWSYLGRLFRLGC